MREMTTNEFANVTVSSLTEPVAVRKYTKTVGTWYPVGTEPGDGQTRIDEASDAGVLARLTEQRDAAVAEIERLTLEIKHLKHDLTEARKPVLKQPMADDLSALGFPPKA